MSTPRAFNRKFGRYTGDSLETSLTGEYDNIYLNGQPKRHQIYDFDPMVDKLEDGDIVLTQVAGVTKIVVRVRGALFHATLSAGA